MNRMAFVARWMGPLLLLLSFNSSPGRTHAQAPPATGSPLPVVSIRVETPLASEAGSRPAEFLLTRTGSTERDLRVAIAISGTAEESADFNPIGPSVTIPAGSRSARIIVKPIDDAMLEPSESVIISVLPPNPAGVIIFPPPQHRPVPIPDPPYEIGTPRSAQAAILDNDSAAPLPTVSLIASQPEAFEEGEIPGIFTVTRLGQRDRELRVYYELVLRLIPFQNPSSLPNQPGTVTLPASSNGSDFERLPGFVDIPAGADSVKIFVNPRDDAHVEGDEELRLRLRSHSTYNVNAPFTASVIIKDNDQPPNHAPTIVWVRPEEGTKIFVSGHATLEAEASDADGAIRKVEFFSGSQSVGVAANPVPNISLTNLYRVAWTNPPPGTFQLRAVATDNLGATAASASVQVEIQIVTNVPPRITLFDPPGPWFRSLLPDAHGSQIQFSALAEDTDGVVVSAVFMVDDLIVGETNALPGGSLTAIQFNGAFPPGINLSRPVHTLSVHVTDDRGASVVSEPRYIGIVPPGGAALKAVGGTVAFSPDFQRWRIMETREIISGLQRTAEGLEFLRGVLEFDARPLVRPSASASLILLEKPWSQPGVPSFHELSSYEADSQITIHDYTRASAVVTRFPANTSAKIQPRIFDVTSAITRPGGGQAGFRIKLDPEPAGTGSPASGSLFHQLPEIPEPHLLVITNKQASLVMLNLTGRPAVVPVALELGAQAIDLNGFIPRVEFYANGDWIGLSSLTFIRPPDPGEILLHRFEWKPVKAGTYDLQAKAFDSLGQAVVSQFLQIKVEENIGEAFVVRKLPSHYSPGMPVIVELRTTPRSGTHVHAVEDVPPAGWSVVRDISHDGRFDTENGKVKFGPYFDSLARTLRYLVTPPPSSSGPQQFLGRASVDGVNGPVRGDFLVQSTLFHPADLNPADGQLSLEEVESYGRQWKQGRVWPIDPSAIPISYVTRAAALWHGGGTYQFDPGLVAAPAWWRPPAAPGEPALPGASQTKRTWVPRHPDGAPFLVRLDVHPGAGVRSYAVEEYLPPGWTVVQASDQGVFDAGQRRVRWGPFLLSQPRALTYQVIVSGPLPGAAGLIGVASFDGTDQPILQLDETGQALFFGSPVLQAIRILRDGRIEFTAAGATGLTYAIEASEDFSRWSELKRLTPGTSPFYFMDNMSENSGQRYYRIKRVEPKP